MDSLRPALCGYQLTCPIQDQAASFLALQTEARTQLLDALDAEGWEVAGPIVYTRTAATFVATTTVRAIHAGDLHPWESRDGYADDMLDHLAA